MIGQIILRRAAGHGPPAAAGEAELGYLFLPQAWGFGYAAEACAAALGWLAGELPGEPVVLFTQTANARSMRLAAKLGFTEVERFEAYGAEQWFGMWSPVTPSGEPAPGVSPGCPRTAVNSPWSPPAATGIQPYFGDLARAPPGGVPRPVSSGPGDCRGSRARENSSDSDRPAACVKGAGNA